MSAARQAARRLVVGPFNRVEGDLEVHLDIADGQVRAARVNAPLYRGFERMLEGKPALDALVIAPRICGICSVSQSAAAAMALAQACGTPMPDNGRLAWNLVTACENVADHYTHFYLFFMADFAREAYRRRPWFDAAAARFRAVHGEATRDGLPARARFLNLMGILAGRWPHNLALQPGGSTRPVEASERLRLLTLLREFRDWLERNLYGDALESVTALDSRAALELWMSRRSPDAGDFRLFLEIARDTGLDALGRGPGRYLSYGAYRETEGPLFAQGVWDGALHGLDPGAISEDLSHAWMQGPAQPAAPAQGVTEPDADKPDAYTWCKAPRLAGRVMETGALARQLVAGHPLVRDLAQAGGSVLARVVARLLEIALLVPAMERWAKALTAGERYCNPLAIPEAAVGAGLTEAARGSLGHWVSLKGGRIRNYQIVAPTTWNFSPRDGQGQPGAVEQALEGTPVGEDERAPVAVQHVVRSFDPCMVCTVH